MHNPPILCIRPATLPVAADGAASDARTSAASAGHGAGLAERRYVRARFGGLPVLIAPELAAQIRAARKEQP
jgi:hypothetical protein